MRIKKFYFLRAILLFVCFSLILLQSQLALAETNAAETRQIGADVTVTVRKSYRIGGQMIAQASYTRNGVTVRDDADQRDEETVHFIYTDHLGSANTLIDQDGTRTESRFMPFGEIRSGGSVLGELTERGFTGHHENREIGLTYMNARYYVPGIGRFASADIIVPNPNNPQSFNRYGYTYNNPLILTDPSGHVPAYCADQYDLAASGDNSNCNPLVDFTIEEDVDLTWTFAEIAEVLKGAYRIDRMLGRHGGGFLDVYGDTVTFHKTGQNGALGFAAEQNLIEVNNANNRDGSLTSITDPWNGAMWAAHELGHAFVYATSPNRTEPTSDFGQAVIDLAQEGIFVGDRQIAGAEHPEMWQGAYLRNLDGYQEADGPFVINPAATMTEDFADLFSNYAHNTFLNNPQGNAMRAFMSDRMDAWVSLAITNNE
ncbi:MAG: RHS repeat-associated core domain-containing protein [Chloroflexota bacterium]